MNLGPSIQYFRQTQGWSRSKLARRADMSNSYLTFVEQNDPRADNNGMATLEKIASALGITMLDLVQKAYELMASSDLKSQHIDILGEALLSFDPKAIKSKRSTLGSCGIAPRPVGLADNEAYALLLEGQGPAPYNKDWYLVVSPQMLVQPHDLVVARFADSFAFHLCRYNVQGEMIIFSDVNGQNPIFKTPCQIESCHAVWILLRHPVA